MSKNRPYLKGGIGESMGGKLQAQVSPSYYENQVRFSFRYCKTHRDWCISNLGKQHLERLYATLGKFEDMTFKDVISIGHKKGFSIEKKDSFNDNLFATTDADFNTHLHFRVNGAPTIVRVFGALKGGLCYVLGIDPDGDVNH
jgi:hypothetical protein